MKTSCNLATYPPRTGSLMLMVESIYNQVDIIRIYFNEYSLAPQCFIDPENKIQRIIGSQNLYDNGKFFPLDFIIEDEIYFTLDDDLIYPPDYVKKTVEAIEKYNCIVTYHGRALSGTQLPYYKGHKAYRCLDKVDSDFVIDVAGTGVTAFDTRYFHPKGLAVSKDVRMSDLIFSLEAAKQDKIIGMLSHEAGWIKHIHNDETICQTEKKIGATRQQQIADEIYKLRNDN